MRRIEPNDTSWLSHDGIYGYVDSFESLSGVGEEDDDAMKYKSIHTVYEEKLNSEIDTLAECFSRNSVTLLSLDFSKNDAITEEIVEVVSRIAKLKAQNSVCYTSAAYQSMCGSSNTTENTVNVKNSALSPGEEKFDDTIIKASDTNINCTLSESWVLEKRLPIANSSQIVATDTSLCSITSGYKDESFTKERNARKTSFARCFNNSKQQDQESIKGKSKVNGVPSLVIEYEDDSKIIISFDKYIFHRFIITFWDDQITDIIAERKIGKWIVAEEYLISILLNAINIPLLKRDFIVVSQIPDALNTIRTFINNWQMIGLDIYSTFYEFLGRVQLQDKRVVIRFFIENIWAMFSLIIDYNFEGEPTSMCSLRLDGFIDVFEALKSVIHNTTVVNRMPILSVCSHIESYCKSVANGSVLLGDKPGQSESGKEFNLDLDVFHMS